MKMTKRKAWICLSPMVLILLPIILCLLVGWWFVYCVNIIMTDNKY